MAWMLKRPGVKVLPIWVTRPTFMGGGGPVRAMGNLYEALAETRGLTLADACASVRGGDIDSLEGVALIVAAEVRFGIRIKDDEVTTWTCCSIPRVAALVRRKLSDG